MTSILNSASSAESDLPRIRLVLAFLALRTVTFATARGQGLAILTVVVWALRNITLQYACLASQAVLRATTLSHSTVKAALLVLLILLLLTSVKIVL